MTEGLVEWLGQEGKRSFSNFGRLGYNLSQIKIRKNPGDETEGEDDRPSTLKSSQRNYGICEAVRPLEAYFTAEAILVGPY